MSGPFRVLIVISSLSVLAGCADELGEGLSMRSAAPVPAKTVALMAEKDMARQAPILIRSFKKESELEVWKQTRTGEFALLKTFPICRWSGQLGPKIKEGDRQAPEGFYSITPASLNPNSRLYLSFDMNYPNAYDRTLGRSGANLMVHGGCSSAGCYSMSDEQMMEIYALLRESFAGGQASVQMQAMPFRMSTENVAAHRLDPNITFWRNLKEGVDRFELAKRPPAIAVCGKRYVFDAKPVDPTVRLDPQAPCPAFKDDEASAAIAMKEKADEAAIEKLASSGAPAVRLVYQDGSQHESFREALASGTLQAKRLYGASSTEYQNISRPDALKSGPQVVKMSSDKPAKPAVPGPGASSQPAVAAASAKPPTEAGPTSLYDRVLAFAGIGGSKP